MISRLLKRLLLGKRPLWTKQSAIARLRQLSWVQDGIVTVISSSEDSHLPPARSFYLNIDAPVISERNPYYIVSDGARTPPAVLTLGVLMACPIDKVCRHISRWKHSADFGGLAGPIMEVFPGLRDPLFKAYMKSVWIAYHWDEYLKTGCLPADLE